MYTESQRLTLKKITYTGSRRLRYLFQIVQTQSSAAYCRILLTLDPMFEISFSGSSDTNHAAAYCSILSALDSIRLRYIFQIVQTQSTAAYCRILPTLDPTFEISSGSSDTNYGSLLKNTTYTGPYV